jgi:hypothetical protein
MENCREQKAGGQKLDKIKGFKALSEGRRKGKPNNILAGECTELFTTLKAHRN